MTEKTDLKREQEGLLAKLDLLQEIYEKLRKKLACNEDAHLVATVLNDYKHELEVMLSRLERKDRYWFITAKGTDDEDIITDEKY